MRLITAFILYCIIISACRQVNKGDTITVDKGVELPIAPCVHVYSKVLGSSVDPVAFCKCLLPKFYEDVKNDPEKLRALKGEGSWYDLAKDKQEVMNQYFQSCMMQTATNDSSAKLIITPRMAEGIKKKMKAELIGSDIEKTNDLDKYCDCMVNSLQTDFTVKEIMQDNFNETEKYQRVIAKCLLSTRKK